MENNIKENKKSTKKEETKKTGNKKVTKKVATKKQDKKVEKKVTKKPTTRKKTSPKPKKRVALVLEGGGMRGTYTAGCLSWLIENGIKFDGYYAISAGAVHLTSYLHQRKDWLYDMSTYYIPEKSSIGLGGFLKEGQVCAFEYKFANAKKHLGFTIEDLKDDTNAKIGLYDLNDGKVHYYKTNEMNDEMLKASCSLPILSIRKKVNGHTYLDGGITDMIPIEEAIKDEYDGYVIITTKAKDYVRKKTNPLVVGLMRLWFMSCPSVSKDYKVRSENYYKQIGIIQDLEKQEKALYRYPTVNMKNITRLGGEVEDLKKLYELGYNDMEAIKEDLTKLFK